MAKKKSMKRKTGTMYWERSGGRYALFKVLKSGGESKLTDYMTRNEARYWLNGVRSAARLGVGWARKVPAIRK